MLNLTKGDIIDVINGIAWVITVNIVVNIFESIEDPLGFFSESMLKKILYTVIGVTIYYVIVKKTMEKVVYPPKTKKYSS